MKPSKVVICLVAAMLLGFLGNFTSVFAQDGSLEFQSSIRKRISEAWHCDAKIPIDVKLSFRISKDGAVYGINLDDGAEDNESLTALHAILHAMPLETPDKDSVNHRYQCSISGTSSSPSFVITSLPFKPSKNGDVSEALGKIETVQEPGRQTFINGPLGRRYYKLLLLRYDFPDSDLVNEEMAKILPYLGLNAKNAHDWIGIARAEKEVIKIERSPLPEVNERSKVRIAAYLESWRCKHDRNILLELEDAYREQIAIQLLASSKGNPMILGNAALLLDQFKTAREQFEFAISEKIAGAKEFSATLKDAGGSGVISPLNLNQAYSPSRVKDDWKHLLNWLPTDTELLLVGGAMTSPDDKVSIVHYFTYFWPEARVERSPYIPGDDIVKSDDGSVAVSGVQCLHAARGFRTPHGPMLGLGSSDSVDIVVVPAKETKRIAQLQERFRKDCLRREIIKGIEIFTLEKLPMMGQTGLGGTGLVCQPVEGVFVFSSSRTYLEEILLRLREQPTDRALPDGIPEWTNVDTAAPVWALRHYDKAYIPFDNTGMYDIVMAGISESSNKEHSRKERADLGELSGMGFSSYSDRIRIFQIASDPTTRNSLGKSWNAIFNYDHKTDNYKPGDGKSNPRITTNGDVITVEGRPTSSAPLSLQLFVSMGYFVAI